MFATKVNYWNYMTSSGTGGRLVRPLTSNGFSVTAGLDTMGSWVRILAATDYDTYLHELQISDTAINGRSRTLIADIGVDPAGGTSYVAIINNLMIGGAGTPANNQQMIRNFMMTIPAGSTVAIRASARDISGVAGTFNACLTSFGRPSAPELIKPAAYCRSYGIDTANSTGTAITFGTTSEGAWTEIGTVATGDYIEQWLVCVDCYDAVMVNLHYHIDMAIGDATNKDIIAEGLSFGSTTSEIISTWTQAFSGRPAKAGEKIYVRGQISGASLDTGQQVAVYGFGG